MTQGEKLKAAIAAAGTDEIALARRMRISPGFLIGVTRDWAELQAANRITAEVLLGLERGALIGGDGECARRVCKSP